MSLVVLIETPERFSDYVGQDMRRWWRHHCKKTMHNGQIWFDVAAPKAFNLREGVKRLASFGVQARVARR
jgi:hypothetical protein